MTEVREEVLGRDYPHSSSKFGTLILVGGWLPHRVSSINDTETTLMRSLL
jgi:hypothetical protein